MISVRDFISNSQRGQVRHCEQSRRAALDICRARGFGPAQQLREKVQSFEVIDVEESADRAGKPRVFVTGSGVVEPGEATQPGPTATLATVDVVELKTGLVEEHAEGAIADPSQLGDEACPVDAQ